MIVFEVSEMRKIFDKNSTDKNYSNEVGDMSITLNLEGNMIDYALYCLEKFDVLPSSHIEMKFYIISCASFYELYFKFRMSLKSKKLIWAKPEDFNELNHSYANFTSKRFTKVVDYGFNEKWIDNVQKEMITELENLRNQLVHFGLQDESPRNDEIIVTKLKYNFFINHKDNIIKLLNDIKLELNPVFRDTFLSRYI